MRILAPFDQTHASQATIPLLALLAGTSRDVEITLLSVLCIPIGVTLRQSVRDGVTVASYSPVRPVPLPNIEIRENALQAAAAERALAQLHDYLLDIAGRLPSGVRVATEAYISDRPMRAIIDCANERAVDLIVIATRSRPRTSSLLFGSTTEAVVDSNVAPVLVVHPGEGDAYREANLELRVTRRARIAIARAWVK